MASTSGSLSMPSTEATTSRGDGRITATPRISGGFSDKCFSCSISASRSLSRWESSALPGLFLGAVALDVQPRRVVVEPHLPQLAVVLGDLLVRLADEELERLADVLLLDAQLPGPAFLDLAEVFGRYLVQRPVDDAILVGGRLADRLGDFRPALGRLEVEQGIRLTLAEPLGRPVDGKEPFADRLAPAVLDAALEEPEDRGLGGIGVEEARPLPQRRAVLRQHPLHDALEQRMARPDEFQVGVADHLLLVEGDLRIGGADLAATTFDVAGQLPQVGRNTADGPDALLVLLLAWLY